MAKPLRLGVAVMVRESGIVLSAVVPGQLKEARERGDVGRGLVVAEEVQVEVIGRVGDGVD